MKLETTLRHAYASGTRRSCPCCLPVNKLTKRSERRLERRLANKLACEAPDITCATCSTIVDESEKYCQYCKSYWQDVKDGLFEERY